MPILFAFLQEVICAGKEKWYSKKKVLRGRTMFGIFKSGKNKQLETLIQRIQMNVSNNYKDAAQMNLKEFEELLVELEESGKLGERQKAYYHEQLDEFKARMKNFTHKDQKPTWVP